MAFPRPSSTRRSRWTVCSSTSAWFLSLVAISSIGWAADHHNESLQPSIRSAQSGPWSAATTWEDGKIPTEGSRVQIRAGHAVVYDVDSGEVIRSIHIAGTLAFAADRNTRLDVGVINIQYGDDFSEEGFDCDAHPPHIPEGEPRPALEVGTPARPIDAQHTALIRLVYIEGMDKQSCPAIVCCGGRMDFHGAPLNRTWVKLGETIQAGESSLTLAERVQGWRPGDRVIVTATERAYSDSTSTTEERVLREVDAAQLALDQPLDHEHLGDGEYRGEVANLSRNVIVESADPEGHRGHTMYHHGSTGSISYAEFRHLGKRDVLGRYSLHYHLVGDSMRGSYVIGASIWDSHNRWLTIHGTNYLVTRDCVGYRSIGHGFFMEDGTEIYNVLDRNLAVGARQGKKLPEQVLSFDRNEGAGFWWANSLNTFTRNVAADNDRYGFRYEATPSRRQTLDRQVLHNDGSRRRVDIRTLPFVRFDDNEVHSSVGLYGVNLGEGVDRVGPDARHPFIVRNLKIWNVHYAFRPQVPSLLVENLHIHEAAYGIYHPHYDNHEYRNVYISKTNAEPFNRGHDDLSAQDGVLAVDGLTFADIRSGSRMPLIQISDHNRTGTAASHFRNVEAVDWGGDRNRALVNRGGGPRPEPTTPTGVPIYLHDWFGAGQHAKIVSTKAGDFEEDDASYREEPLLTGDESRVADVRDIEFPQLLDPLDDLAPCTVITHIQRQDDHWIVAGTTSDNGTVERVVINGQPAVATADNFSQWEVVVKDLDAKDWTLTAHAEDAAANIEGQPHVVSVPAVQ